MDIKLKYYMHSANGISLQIIPETDAEEDLLKGIFEHGSMGFGHPCKERGRTGFYINWKQEDDTKNKP